VAHRLHDDRRPVGVGQRARPPLGPGGDHFVDAEVGRDVAAAHGIHAGHPGCAAGREDVAEERADRALTDHPDDLPRDVAELLDGVEHAGQGLKHDRGGGRQPGVTVAEAVTRR
jgi:hypothetical protein